MGSYVDAARYAVTGIFVGSAVAAGSDMVYNYALGSVVPPPPGTGTNAGQFGRAAFALVAAGATVAGGVMAGEQILDLLNSGVNDPLFRAVFYTTAISGSATTQQASGLVRALIGRGFQSTPAAASAPMTSTQKSTSSNCASCQK